MVLVSITGAPISELTAVKCDEAPPSVDAAERQQSTARRSSYAFYPRSGSTGFRV